MAIGGVMSKNILVVRREKWVETLLLPKDIRQAQVLSSACNTIDIAFRVREQRFAQIYTSVEFYQNPTAESLEAAGVLEELFTKFNLPAISMIKLDKTAGQPMLVLWAQV